MAQYVNNLAHTVDIPSIGVLNVEPGETFEADDGLRFPAGIDAATAAAESTTKEPGEGE